MIIKRKIRFCISALAITASFLYTNAAITSSNETTVPAPSLTVTGSLTAFSTCVGTASAAKNLQVSGSSLTADVIVMTAPGYEIAKAIGGPYSDMLSFSPTGGTLASTTVYVRLSSSAENGASGNIAFFSIGADTQVRATGTGIVNATPIASMDINTPFLCSGATINFNAGSACGTNGAIDFSGPTTYATRPLISNVVDNYTMEIWAKWNGTVPSGNDMQILFYNGHTGNGGYGILLRPEGTLDILMGNTGNLFTSAKLIPGIWQHIAIVRSAGTSKLYLNGVEYAVTGYLGVPKNPNTTPGNLTSVGGGESNNLKFYGALDEAKFWTVARTATQIQADMKNCTEGPATGLLGYWSFNEGAGNTAADGSGNGYTFNLTDAAWNTLGAPTGGTYLWNFGDGNTSTNGAVSYTYNTIGTKTITLTTTNSNGCSATTTRTINVDQSPTASITSAATTACGLVTLTASGGISYSWSGGNSPNTATNTFNTSGTYKVTVTDANGCIATASQAVIVNPLPAPPSVGGVPTSASANTGVAGVINAFTVDKDGNAYTAGASATLYKALSTGNGTTFVSGLSGISALVCDASGNVYVAERNAGNIKKVTPAKVVTVFTTGITNISGLAFDASGNLYAAQSTTGSIYKIIPAGVSSVLVTGLTSPSALAVAPSGDLYAIQSGNSIISINSAGAITTIVTGLSTANGIAFDASGVLHVTQRGTRTIDKITADGDVVPVVTDISGNFLAIDASGKLYSSSTVSSFYRITLPQSMVTSVVGSGSLTLTSASGLGLVVDWYDVPVGGSPIRTGSDTYTTPVLTNTTTYYTQSRNSATGCISAYRTAITVVVNSLALNRYGELVAGRAVVVGKNGQIGDLGIDANGKTIFYPSLLSATLAVTAIGAGSATSGGLVTADGGFAVTETGLCWGPAIDPTIANSKISTGSAWSYTNTITGLTPGVKYYVRAYAINAGGIAYGKQVSFTAL